MIPPLLWIGGNAILPHDALHALLVDGIPAILQFLRDSGTAVFPLVGMEDFFYETEQILVFLGPGREVLDLVVKRGSRDTRYFQ